MPSVSWIGWVMWSSSGVLKPYEKMEKTGESSLRKRYHEGALQLPNTTQRRKQISSPMTYVAMIARAILSSPLQRLPLSEIYKFIEQRFPEFTENRARWKNTVRHNLSLHDCFFRGEVSVNKKGCNWRIHPFFIADFRRGDFSRHKFSQLHTPASSLERRYATNPRSVNADVNQGTRCYTCESAGFFLPSPCLLLQFQRRGMQHPQIPRFPWQPGTL